MAELDELVEQVRRLPDGMMVQGRRALVVGGNKGIGQAMSLALAACGATVAVAGRDMAALGATVSAIATVGGTGHAIACDATDEANVEAMIAEAVDAMGGLDILVNSQGAAYLQPAAEFDMDQWQRIMDINLKSLVLTCKHAGRRMLAQGRGKIINISSVRGFQGRIGDLAYSPSKGAVNNLTKSLALEWGPKGVNVNAIAPAFVKTALNADLLADPEKAAWVLSRSPMGRLGTLADFFGPVVFLASDASNFVNGHVLMVDGGWTVA